MKDSQNVRFPIFFLAPVTTAHSQDFGEFDFIGLLSIFYSRNIRLESLHAKFCFYRKLATGK